MDSTAHPSDSPVGVAPRNGPWRSTIAGAFVAAIVAFVWAVQDSPSGPEGLMGLGYFASEFIPALPRAMALGVAVVWVANKLVSLGPNYWPPWDPLSPPPETIDGHYKPAWLAGFATPFVVGLVFGVLPLVVMVRWLRMSHVQASYGGGASVLTAAVAAMLLVPRLGRSVMREVDSRV